MALGERAKRSTEVEATTWLRSLQMLPIRVDDETAARAWSDNLRVARAYGLSVYDAAYLELAIRSGLPMASLDDNLNATAASAGVGEFQP